MVRPSGGSSIKPGMVGIDIYFQVGMSVSKRSSASKTSILAINNYWYLTEVDSL